MARAALGTRSTLLLAVFATVTPARAGTASVPESRVPSATPPRASGPGEQIRYWTGRTLLVGGVAIGGIGASLLALEPFADGTPFVGVGLGALSIGAVAAGIGLPLWLSNRAGRAVHVEVHPNAYARGLTITGRF